MRADLFRTGLARSTAIAGLLVTFSAMAAAAANYSQSPSLDQAVSSGKLPPVAQRLPSDPLVVKPAESIGSYGGTWRQVVIGGDDTLLERTIGYEQLLRWTPDWSAVVPDIAASVTTNSDATQFDFKLRHGLKWSDGQPFTADDIMFWYNDILMDKDVTPAPPAWLTSDGVPVKVEKKGDDDVVFTFAKPNGLFLENMATDRGSALIVPAHYLKQFHKKYNPDADALAKQHGASNWVDMLTNEDTYPNRWRDADAPVMDAWKLSVPYNGASQVVAVRNPYFYKVDPNGQQLPYIDKVTFDVVQDPQAVVLKAINGDIDMQTLYLDTVDVRPVIVQNQQHGNYHLFISQPAWSNAMMINLNQTDKNPALRKVFANRDFRIGLSYAINRDELNQLIYAGIGQPYQAAPRPGTKLYDQDLATQYTEYSVDKANAYLDKAGLTKKDAQGFRLDENGNRISFPIDVLPPNQTQIDALERIKAYWAKVGIEMQVRPTEQSLIFARLQTNDEDALVWIGGGGYDLLGLLDPKWYFPHEYQSSFATAWGLYYQNPKDPNGEKPDAAALKQQQLYEQVKAAPTLNQQMALMRQILDIDKQQFYVIGTNMEPDRIGIVKNNMHNVAKSMPNTWFYMTPGPTNPEQYYFSAN